MDDFRTQLTTLVDAFLAEGRTPAFVIVDLVGAEQIRHSKNADTLERFRETCMSALAGASRGGEAFSYGDYRIVGVLPGFDRLRTFALVEKMRRTLPLLAQSYDCYLCPEFDTIEYDPEAGVPGIITQIARPRDVNRDVA
jgi:hypothetical protein